MNIRIFRLTENEISVDGVLFIKSEHGVYRAEREEYQDFGSNAPNYGGTSL